MLKLYQNRNERNGTQSAKGVWQVEVFKTVANMQQVAFVMYLVHIVVVNLIVGLGRNLFYSGRTVMGQLPVEDMKDGRTVKRIGKDEWRASEV